MQFLVVRLTSLIALLCICSYAQNTSGNETQASEAKGMPPRSSPADYPAHAQAGKVTIAAEFTGHSVPRAEGSFSTDAYVVVEAGLFGASGEHLQLSTGDFSLRINGKKPLPSEPYGLVLSSLKDPQWVPPDQGASKKSKTGINTGGQSGDSGPPPPVHVPVELQRAMAQYVQKSSFPDGDRVLPEAGLLFFPYRGSTKKIHSLELTYSGPAGQTSLELQP